MRRITTTLKVAVVDNNDRVCSSEIRTARQQTDDFWGCTELTVVNIASLNDLSELFLVK